MPAVEGDVLRIHSLRQISWQHPSQWEAVTEEGRSVYVPYKWGELTVYLGPVGGGPDSWEQPPVIDMEVGHHHDCQIDWEEVVQVTGIEMVDGPCPAR